MVRSTRTPSQALRLIGALATLGWLAAPVTAAAQPPLVNVHAAKPGRHAVVHDRPQCRTVYTFGRRGQGKQIVCDLPRRAAPAAHRSGRKHHAPPQRGQHRHYRRPAPPPQRYLHWQNRAPWHHQGAYDPAPAAFPPNRCDTGLVAGVIGGTAGAIVGSRIGSGNGRIAATAAGTLVGTLAGFGIGDALDRTCLANALEFVPDDHTVHWQPAAAAATPRLVTPDATWQGEDGRYCREFTSTATIGNQTQSVYGRACRQPDGAWEIVS